MSDDLRAAADDILAGALPADLRRLVDQALSSGAAPKEILARVRAVASGRTLTVLAAEAYLRSKS